MWICPSLNDERFDDAIRSHGAMWLPSLVALMWCIDAGGVDKGEGEM
jgi:hypothetical protein